MLRGLENGAGRRNTLIVIQSAEDGAANEAGEVLPTWSTFTERWAEVLPSSGREFTAAMQTNALVTAVCKLPYDAKTAAISSRMRVKIGARVLNIASAFNERESNEKIVLWLTEEK